MSDLNLPPPAEEPTPPYLLFPRDMKVEAGHAPMSWFVNHTANMVWLWVRDPLSVRALPFSADKAMALAATLAEAATKSIELANNNAALIAVRAPILGPDGVPL